MQYISGRRSCAATSYLQRERAVLSIAGGADSEPNEPNPGVLRVWKDGVGSATVTSPYMELDTRLANAPSDGIDADNNSSGLTDNLGIARL